MPGCAAYSCSNTNKKGFYMARFPKDPERRALWIAAVNRPELSLTSTPALCEIHFDETSWEKVRVDGTRKLKCNALPTKLLPRTGVKRRAKVIIQKANGHNEHRTTVSTAPEIAENSNTVEVSNFTQEHQLPDRKVLTTNNNIMTNCDASAGSGSSNHHLQEILASSQSSEANNDSTLVTSPYQRNSTSTSPAFENHHVCNRLLQKAERMKNLLMKKLKAARIENRKLRQSQGIAPKNVFNEDQVDLLERNLKKCGKWSDDTVKKALKIKFSCGNTGYQELLARNIPLPSLRTLSRKIEHIHFNSGVQDDVFKLLELKFASVTNEHGKECVLVFDEISINAGIFYNGATKEYVGKVTLPGHTGDATHALVFMLAGITVRWKQIVAYYYTGDSVQGQLLKPIVTEIIKKTEDIGLRVCNITCDMGSANRALWSSFGIQASRLNVTHFVAHPVDDERKLYFIADVPHLLKNLKCALFNNKCIYLSENVQTKNNLPSNCIRMQHFDELIKSQSNLQFLLAPKLNAEDLDTSKSFAKMRVNKAKNVFSHSVGTSLKLISDIKEEQEFETTAWFVEKISHWFALMTSRHPGMALSKVDPNKYVEAIEDLKEIIEIFETMQVGEKRCWEPIQTGVIIATSSILRLSEHFLEERQLPYLLTGRFTQDCVENLFSVLRSKHPVPNAVQFQQNLRLIGISHYMKNINNSNYEYDDRDFCEDLLRVPPVDVNSNHVLPSPSSYEVSLPIKDLKLKKTEMNAFYYAVGYLINSIKKTEKVCACCMRSLGSTKSTPYYYARLTKLRSYKDNTLFYCNPRTFSFFLKMERVFRTYVDYVRTNKIDSQRFFSRKFEIIQDEFANCHSLRSRIIRRFIAFRMRIGSKSKSKVSKVHASKTMAMHRYIT